VVREEMIKNVLAFIWLMKRNDGKCSENYMDKVGGENASVTPGGG
jgi:hypothetical protein